MQWMLRLFSPIVVCSTLVACGGGGGDGPAGPAAVAEVRVTPPASVFEKDSARAQATAFDASGSALSGRTITWSSSNIAVATVRPTGMVTGVTSGTATIVATSEGKSGSASVTVTRDPAVSSISLSPLVASIPSGGNLQLTVVVKNAHGQDLPNQAVSFTSSNAAIATVSSAGVVASAGPAGTANIVANVGSVASAPLALTVTAGPIAKIVKVVDVPASPVAGSSNPVSVKVTDAAGNPVSGATVTFSVTSGGGTITPSATTDGTGTAGASFTLGKTVGANAAAATVSGLAGASVSFSATTVAGPAAALTVLPGSDGQSAAVGTAVAVSVKLTDANGNPIVGQQVTFSFGTGSTSGVGLVPTDANGVAVFNHWVLQTKGENDLLVNSGSVPQLIIKATGT
jgi:trimeric autotransporter adhesin